jgi:hypothetical protein
LIAVILRAIHFSITSVMPLIPRAAASCEAL